MPIQYHPAVIIAAIVGALSGVISLLLIFFYAGRRIGELETKVKEVDAKCVGQREWGELGNKVDTLYNVYVMEALKSGKGGNNADRNDTPKSSTPKRGR